MKKLYFSIASLLMLTTGLSQGSINKQIVNPSVQINQLAQPIVTVNSQSGVHTCKSHELTKKDYENQGVWQSFNQEYQTVSQQMRNQLDQVKTQGNTISVIFHVVHEGEALGTGTNLSNAAVNAIFDELVEDFSLNNTDQANARNGFGFVPDNVGINFCLATQDPAGNPLAETGITRFQTSKTFFDPDDPTEENAMKSAPFGSPIWDRNDYLNVWICDITNGANFGVAGYAYRPGTSYLPTASIDGIVIDYNLGTGGNVLTHEVGHYLGLDHTWGGSGSCGSDDGFSDTPNTQGPSFNFAGSCSGNQETCSGTQTQYENYMDYSNCTVMFTAEQSVYMNSILSGIRSSLLASLGCDAAGAPVTDFTSSPTSPMSIPINGAVVFADLSSGSPTAWNWSVSGVQGTDWAYTNGTLASSQNPEIEFYTIGNYDVTLIASNSFGAGSTMLKTNYVTVVAPAAGSACDTLRNWDPNDAGGFFSYGTAPGGWGSYPGHADNDGTGLISTQYAEKFTYAGTAEVRQLRFPIFEADTLSAAGNVVFHIYADVSGTPGASIASETISVRDLDVGFFNVINFSTPVSVTGTFWAGFELEYGADQDTVRLAMTNTITGGNDSYYSDITGIGWFDMSGIGIAGSIALDVLLSNGADPIVDFQYNENEICVGGDVIVNASGSTNVTNYFWYQTDDPFTTIISTNETAATTFNFAGTAGDYSIYLFIYRWVL